LLDKNPKLKKIIGPYQSWEYMKQNYEGKSASSKLMLLKKLSLFKQK
jgi:hypothetical protein